MRLHIQTQQIFISSKLWIFIEIPLNANLRMVLARNAPHRVDKQRENLSISLAWLADIDDSDPMVAMTTPTTISSFIEHIFAYN